MPTNNPTTIEIIIGAVVTLATGFFTKEFWTFLKDRGTINSAKKAKEGLDKDKKITDLEITVSILEKENLLLKIHNHEMSYNLEKIIPVLRIIKDDDEREKLLTMLSPESKVNLTSNINPVPEP